MLNKLMKYDIKSLSITLLPIYGITLLLSVVARITSELSKTITIFKIPSSFILTLSVLTSISIIFGTFFVGIIKFYNSMIKDEGYLTHTLPVKKTSLILSKLITSISFQIISILIAVVTLYISFGFNHMDVIKVLMELTREISENNKWAILLIALSFVFGHINNILLMYTSISLGQKHNSNKLVYSVIYGIVLYNISQIVSVIFLIPLMLNEHVMIELEKQVPDADVFNIILIITLVISVVISIVYFIITKKMLEKKLNLE